MCCKKLKWGVLIVDDNKEDRLRKDGVDIGVHNEGDESIIEER